MTTPADLLARASQTISEGTRETFGLIRDIGAGDLGIGPVLDDKTRLEVIVTICEEALADELAGK